MITKQEIRNLVTEWNLREDVIEKDYVIGWLLWGIGANPDLNSHWAFKGGTSLKKCYIETYRFSEDLDFTVMPGGPDKPETIEPLIKSVLERVHEESGIDFSISPPVFKHYDKYLCTEGSIYYRGPRGDSRPARMKLDINGSEKAVRPTILRKISHSYSDALPDPATVRCYAFEEVFAEKLRAMGERGRPRDLYDIVFLFRREDLRAEPNLIRTVLAEKCAAKGISIPTLDSIQNASTKSELISEWKNMLGHQLQALPQFDQFWDELPNIFNWLNGVSVPATPAPMKIDKNEVKTWSPPPTIWQWGKGVPLESIRFAAVNHLCVELGYDHKLRIIEPYAVRRTSEDNIVLHAVKADTGESRTYRVDRIESVKVTTRTFRPRYQIEISSAGTIQTPPTSRKVTFDTPGFTRTPRTHSRRTRIAGSYGIKYIFQCPSCMKKFTKSTSDSTLRKHKDSYGSPCNSRHGYFIDYKH